MPERPRRIRFMTIGFFRSFALLLCLGTLAGVLIWAKLRLVTDIPRSAYADPKERVDDPESCSCDGAPAGADCSERACASSRER